MAAQKTYSSHNIINKHGADLPLGFDNNQHKFQANNFQNNGKHFNSYHSGHRQQFNKNKFQHQNGNNHHSNVAGGYVAKQSSHNNDNQTAFTNNQKQTGIPNYYSKELINA